MNWPWTRREDNGPSGLALRGVTLGRHLAVCLALGAEHGQEVAWDTLPPSALADFLDEVLGEVPESPTPDALRLLCADVYAAWSSAVDRAIACGMLGAERVKDELHYEPRPGEGAPPSLTLMACSMEAQAYCAVRDLPLREAVLLLAGHWVASSLREEMRNAARVN